MFLKPIQPDDDDDDEYDREAQLLDYAEGTPISALPFDQEYVYSKKGTKYRVWVRPQQAEEECSVFADLSHQTKLVSTPISQEQFDNADYDDDMDYEDTLGRQPSTSKTKYHIYPQAFSPRYGNIQTFEEPFTFFADFTQKIREWLQKLTDEHIPEDVILFVSAQLYNELAHKLRGQFGRMEVQTAGIAAAFAGEQFRETSASRKFRALQRRLDAALPHKLLQSAINNTAHHFGLRNEAYCIVEVEKLPIALRTGG